jgi:hypothetical protein
MALSGHNLSKNWADPQPSDAFRRALGLFQAFLLANPKTPTSVLRFAAIKDLERRKDSTGLTSKFWLEIDPPDRDFSD